MKAVNIMWFLTNSTQNYRRCKLLFRNFLLQGAAVYIYSVQQVFDLAEECKISSRKYLILFSKYLVIKFSEYGYVLVISSIYTFSLCENMLCEIKFRFSVYWRSTKCFHSLVISYTLTQMRYNNWTVNLTRTHYNHKIL